MAGWTTRTLGVDQDYRAPDGSGIRLLATLPRAGLCLCELPVGAASGSVRHKTVDELWYVISGIGEITRSSGAEEETIALAPGTSITIPQGVAFQFRSLGGSPLQILIVTAPQWPGPDEAEVLSPPPKTARHAPSEPGESDERRLVRLNHQLADAERTKNTAYFERVLSADLEFRRADGSVVNKQKFIEQLADHAYEYVEPSDIRSTVLGTMAVVTLVVRAAGTAGGKPFRGVYRNIRLFSRSKTDDSWELERWYDVQIESPAVPPSAKETYERILGKPHDGDETGLRWHTLNELYGVVWNRGILSDRDRRLITLAVLAAQGATKQLQGHLHGARTAGLSREELLETAIQVAYYGGWARGTSAQKWILQEFVGPG